MNVDEGVPLPWKLGVVETDIQTALDFMRAVRGYP